MSDNPAAGINAARLCGLLIIAVMVAVNPFGWDHFIPLRGLLVPSLGFGAVAVHLWSSPGSTHGALDGRSHSTQQRRANLLWIALLTLGVLASLNAADPWHAWVGTPDRRLGLLSWVLFGSLFVVAQSFGSRARRIVVDATVVGTIGCGLLTLVEVAGWGPWSDVEFANSRFGGPFGQPAYLGAAMSLAVPIVAGVAAAASGRRQVAASAAVVLGVATLAMSQARAAWVGVAVAVIIVAGAHPGAVRRHARSLGLAMTALLAVASLTPLGSRALSLPRALFGGSGVVAGRVDEWQVGWRALLDAPLLGHGPEGYRTVFGSVVDTDYVVDHGREVVTDRAHSGPLDVALSFGMPAAVVWLGLMLLVAMVGWRAIRSGGAEHAGLGAGALAYAVQQVFLFPLSDLDAVFWIATGVMLSVEGRAPDDTIVRRESARGLSDGSVVRPALAGLAGAAAVIAVAAGVLDLIADRRVATVENSTTATTAQIDAVTAPRPDSIRYHFIASRLARQNGVTEPATLATSISHIDAGREWSAADPALRLERSRLLVEQARRTVDPTERQQRLAAAADDLRRLVDDEPNHPLANRNLGVSLALLGDADGAVAALTHAASLAPGDDAIARDLAEARRLGGIDG